MAEVLSRCFLKASGNAAKGHEHLYGRAFCNGHGGGEGGEMVRLGID